MLGLMIAMVTMTFFNMCVLLAIFNKADVVVKLMARRDNRKDNVVDIGDR